MCKKYLTICMKIGDVCRLNWGKNMRKERPYTQVEKI